MNSNEVRILEYPEEQRQQKVSTACMGCAMFIGRRTISAGMEVDVEVTDTLAE